MIIVGLIAIVVLAVIAGVVYYLFRPQRETLRVGKHHIPADIKQDWEALQYGPRHAAGVTQEFSAIPHGANKHYVDQTAGFRMSDRTDTVMMRAIQPDTV